MKVRPQGKSAVSWRVKAREAIWRFLKRIGSPNSDALAVFVILTASGLALTFGRKSEFLTVGAGWIVILVTALMLIAFGWWTKFFQWLGGRKLFIKSRLRRFDRSRDRSSFETWPLWDDRLSLPQNAIRLVGQFLVLPKALLGPIDYLLVRWMAPIAGVLPLGKAKGLRPTIWGLVALALIVVILLVGHRNFEGFTKTLYFLGLLVLAQLILRLLSFRPFRRLLLFARYAWLVFILVGFPAYAYSHLDETVAIPATIVGLLTVLAMLRRWHWFESDRDLFIQISKSRNKNEEDYRILKVDRENPDHMAMTLTCLACLPVLLTLGLMQFQDIYQSFEVSETADFWIWFGFVGVELAKSIPFIDWADIFNIPPNSGIRPFDDTEVGSAIYAIFFIRAVFDVFLIATIAQSFGVYNRKSQQFELLKREKPAISRLDPIFELEKLGSLTQDDIYEFPEYDKNRLLSLARGSEGESIKIVAKILLLFQGAFEGLNDEEREPWTRDISRYFAKTSEVDALANHFQDSKDPQTKASAIEILRHLIETREKTLVDSDLLPDSRNLELLRPKIMAIATAGRDTAHILGLVALLKSGDNKVQALVARCLGQVGHSKQALRALGEVLNKYGTPKQVKDEAALALGLHGQIDQLETHFLYPRRWYLPLRFVPFFRRWKFPLNRRPYRKLFDDPKGREPAFHAALVLQHHGCKPPQHTLKKIIKDKKADDVIRILALLSLLQKVSKRRQREKLGLMRNRLFLTKHRLRFWNAKSRRLTALALGKYQGVMKSGRLARWPDTLRLILQLKFSPTAVSRAFAASALGDIGSGWARVSLISKLRKPVNLKKLKKVKIAIAAATSLGKLEHTPKSQAALESLMNRNRIPNYESRFNKFKRTFGREERDRKDYYVPWVDLVDSDKARVELRWTAILALAWQKETSSTEFLQEQIQDERQWACAPFWIREKALWCLSQIDEELSTEVVGHFENVADADDVARVRATAVWALGKHSSELVHPLLREKLSAKFAIERVGAIKGLAATGSSEASSLLNSVAKNDRVLHVREAAAMALEILEDAQNGSGDLKSGLNRFTRSPSLYQDEVGRPHPGYSRAGEAGEFPLRYHYEWGI